MIETIPTTVRSGFGSLLLVTVIHKAEVMQKSYDSGTLRINAEPGCQAARSVRYTDAVLIGIGASMSGDLFQLLVHRTLRDERITLGQFFFLVC